MPKKQSSAAKRARTAVRSSGAGAKYTRALRETGTPLHLHLPLLDRQALPEEERPVVEGLRALAAEGGLLPVRVAEPDPEVVAARVRAAEKRSVPERRRWAVVQAAVDGYVLREVPYGPNRSGDTPAERGPRVPVPVRGADGTVAVVAMPAWARLHEGRWIWAHTGWPIEAPGRIVDPPQEFAPAPELRWQVAAWLDLGWRRGEVLGEDYNSGTSTWETVGWCTSREDARLIARSCTAYLGSYARADVIEHGTDNGVVSLTTDTYLPAPDASGLPRPTPVSGPRPASPREPEVPEPDWHPSLVDVPDTSLVVWTGTGWRTLVWTGTHTRLIAFQLGIGAGGPYAWAEGWGPRHPDRDLHDWTQEGRELHERFPEPNDGERTRGREAARAAQHDALVAALAERGGLTREQAAARLAEGGQTYRTFLDLGQAAIARALNAARVVLPGGPERTALRHALDDLTDRHLVPDDAERLANAQLDGEIEARRAPEVTAWCRRAVAEYLAPAPDPAAAGVDGFGPLET